MKKTVFFVFFAVFITAQQVQAQSVPADTTRTAAVAKNPKQIAREDVKIFKLSPDMLKRFKADRFAETSDYFKPTKPYASDYALLNDSDYVQTFRKAAYNRALRQPLHPTGRVLFVLGCVFGGIALLVVLLAAVLKDAYL